MKIYFSGSIRGGRDRADIYADIVAYLQQKGCEIPSAHIAHPDVMKLEETSLDEEVFVRDIGWIEESEVVIAEVSTPSLGVGYEICYALQLGKPVLCLYHQDLAISKMIKGNTSPTIKVRPYSDRIEMMKIIDEFLDSIN